MAVVWLVEVPALEELLTLDIVETDVVEGDVKLEVEEDVKLEVNEGGVVLEEV